MGIGNALPKTKQYNTITLAAVYVNNFDDTFVLLI